MRMAAAAAVVRVQRKECRHRSEDITN